MPVFLERKWVSCKCYFGGRANKCKWVLSKRKDNPQSSVLWHCKTLTTVSLFKNSSQSYPRILSSTEQWLYIATFHILLWTSFIILLFLSIIKSVHQSIFGPGRVAQLVRAVSWYPKVVGSIPRQGTYKNQPMNAQISGTTSQCFSLFL